MLWSIKSGYETFAHMLKMQIFFWFFERENHYELWTYVDHLDDRQTAGDSPS